MCSAAANASLLVSTILFGRPFCVNELFSGSNFSITHRTPLGNDDIPERRE